MKPYKMAIVCIVILSLFSTINCFGYRALAHKVINRSVISQKLSAGPVKSYFAVQLGYSSAAKTVYNKKIIDWFEEAGPQEDEPGFRTKNHFLDPVANSGFSGFLFGSMGSGDPTAVWAQKAVGEQSPGGAHSWQDAREFFYTALISNTTAVRE